MNALIQEIVDTIRDALTQLDHTSVNALLGLSLIQQHAQMMRLSTIVLVNTWSLLIIDGSIILCTYYICIVHTLVEYNIRCTTRVLHS